MEKFLFFDLLTVERLERWLLGSRLDAFILSCGVMANAAVTEGVDAREGGVAGVARAVSPEMRSITTAGGKRGWTMRTETRPTATGFNAPSGKRREEMAVSVLHLAAFFNGPSAPRDGVACETAGLVWFVATSR